MKPRPPRAAALLLLGFAGQAQPGRPDGPPSAAQVPPGQDEHERRIGALYEGALVGAQDGTDFAETPGYRRMLEMLALYGEDELSAKAERELDFAALMQDPAAWRGEIVRRRALVAGIETVRLEHPLGSRVDVYRATLVEPDGSEGVIVDSLQPPPELEMRRDVVDVEGVFFRTVRYENRLGAERVAPLLIARGLRRVTEGLPRKTVFSGYAAILLGLAVAFLVVRILLTLRGRSARGSHAAGAARAAQLLRERARANAAESRRLQP